MKLRTITKRNLEILLWLVIAPVGLDYTIKRLQGYSCWNSSAGRVFMSGNFVFWILLIVAQGVSFSAPLISNLVVLFVFLHAAGLYEVYRSSAQRADARTDMQMYTFHTIAIIGLSLLVFKGGRDVACVLSNFLKIATTSCDSYLKPILWGAIALEVLVFIYAQAKGFFNSALINSTSEISRDMPFKQGHEMAFGFYLTVLLLSGLLW